MFLHLTTVPGPGQEPIGALAAQFVGGTDTNTFMIVAIDPGHTGNPAVLYPFGPFATTDDARAWATAHLAPYMTYTVAPLAAPQTSTDANTRQRKPVQHSTTARPARANTLARQLKPYNLTRLRYGTRPGTSRHGFTAREIEHGALGPVVELTVLGPDPDQRDGDHHRIKTILRIDHPHYEVTDQHPHLFVRRLSDAELHVRADRAAARTAPHIASLLTNTTPPASEAAHALFHAILAAAWEKASDDIDDYDLMCLVRDMTPHDALTALKKALLPSQLIEPIADALTTWPHTPTPPPPAESTTGSLTDRPPALRPRASSERGGP